MEAKTTHPRLKAANSIFETFSRYQDREPVIKAVNKIVVLYNQHQDEIQYKIDTQDFDDVDGQDFNEWGHDTLDEIEDCYFALRVHLGSLNYQQGGINIIEVQ